MDLVFGGNLDELHLALAPRPLRLHPQRRAPVVEYAVVFVVAEVAVTLHQAEAPGVVVEKAVGHHLRRIVERPPDALARTRPDGQALGIMNLRPPVARLALVGLGEPEHRGERCNAKLLDVAPRKDACLDVHDHPLRPAAGEAEGTRRALAVEQRGDHQRVGLLLEVEFGEARELLRLRGGGVDAEATRRDAILVQLARRAEIGGTEECQPVVVGVALVHAETREAKVIRQFCGDGLGLGPEGEEVRAVEHIA